MPEPASNRRDPDRLRSMNSGRTGDGTVMESGAAIVNGTPLLVMVLEDDETPLRPPLAAAPFVIHLLSGSRGGGELSDVLLRFLLQRSVLGRVA